MLVAKFELTRGNLCLRMDLDVAAGETVALVGPNGAGKSSTLLALAGLLRIARGEIASRGRMLDQPGRAFVPARDRDVGFVFQDSLLLPHLRVWENVAYGLLSRGAPRSRVRAEATAWLDRVGIGAADHSVWPTALSGGQAQRVALARALAPSPSVLLLDEPLAAVDASARIALRRDLRAQLSRFAGTCVLVAHDMSDALALADRIVVLERGGIVQSGEIADLARAPASRFVADLVGMNCYHGSSSGGVVRIHTGGELRVASEIEGAVQVTVHPRAVSLFRDRPSGSPRNVWMAPVEGVEPAVDRVRVWLGGELPIVAEVTPAAVEDLRLHRGDTVWVAVKATEMTITSR